MSFFTRVANTVSIYLSPRKKRNVVRAKPHARSPLPSLSPTVEEASITVQPRKPRKRRASSHSRAHATKRARFSPEDANDDLEGSTLLPSTSKASHSRVASPKSRIDRELMPPPSLNKGGSSQVKHPDLPDLSDEGNKSPRGGIPGRSTRDATSPVDLESISSDLRARYQAAMTLPENSGIWAEAERDLFFRLALRGFEPLLPPNWMLDFPTYPLALYSNENSPPPLLQSMSGNDFRATKALKDLGEMGKRIRDRALASPPSSGTLRPEPIISATVSSYIDWALTDAQMHPSQRAAALPVHVITTLQKSQSTHDAITAMTAQLHSLAARHRERRGIRESVEREATSASEATHVLEDDADLPILTGIIICSSLVVIVTLNAHTVPPEPTSSAESKNDAKDESGLRFIATFDFSESGMDVWNALAVAIVAMHIRKMMLLQYELAQEAGECDAGGNWELIAPENASDDDPDA